MGDVDSFIKLGFRSSHAIGYEDGPGVAATTAHEWPYYNAQYNVLVCRYHVYAIQNLATHLRLQNKVRSYERSTIEKIFASCEPLEPANVASPPPLRALLR